MELLFFYIVFLIFFLGTIFGSFLNVIAYELEDVVFKEKNSFWKRINRRSACPKCKKKLSAKELVPIFSFLFLRRRCLSCKTKISQKYFWIEFFSGLSFLGIFWHIFLKTNTEFSFLFFLENNFWIEFLFFIPIISAIILIFLFDWKHKIIPAIVIFPAILYSFFYILLDFQNNGLYPIFNFDFFIDDILRSGAFALPFFALWFLSRGRAMGFADWELVFFLSLFLNDSLQNLLFVFGAFWIGTLYFLPSIFMRKVSFKKEVPFGPFIIISFFVIYFFNLNYIDFFNFFN